MVTHAQSNKGYYPGITSKGDAWTLGADNISGKSGGNVQARFAILIEGDFVTPDYVLHPNDPEPHTAFNPSGTDPFDIEHYGYALLELTNNTNPGPNAAMNTTRSVKSRMEWSETMNSQAIVISDRLIDVGSFGDPTTYTGVWSDKPGESEWGVVWNDNHTTAENVALFETNYAGIRNTSDDLFSRLKTSSGNVQSPASPSGSPGNAMMVSRNGAALLQNP
jgi:hypothetical protein